MPTSRRHRRGRVSRLRHNARRRELLRRLRGGEQPSNNTVIAVIDLTIDEDAAPIVGAERGNEPPSGVIDLTITEDQESTNTPGSAASPPIVHPPPSPSAYSPIAGPSGALTPSSVYPEPSLSPWSPLNPRRLTFSPYDGDDEGQRPPSPVDSDRSTVILTPRRYSTPSPNILTPPSPRSEDQGDFPLYEGEEFDELPEQLFDARWWFARREE